MEEIKTKTSEEKDEEELRSSNSKTGVITANSTIDLNRLHELRKDFEEADGDGGGSLNLEEFVQAFGKVLGDDLGKQGLVNLFMKIDANSDGRIDWHEFTEFMLLENKGHKLMEDAEPGVEFIKVESSKTRKDVGTIGLLTRSTNVFQCEKSYSHSHNHNERVTHLKCFSHLDYYISYGNDSKIKVWSHNLETNQLEHVETIGIPATMTPQDEQLLFRKTGSFLHKSNKSDQFSNLKVTSRSYLKRGTATLKPARENQHGSCWPTDCCYMFHSKCIAVTSMNRSINFYNLSFESIGRIHPLVFAPICLAYYHGQLVGSDAEVLVCGDENGYVHVWHLKANAWMFPFNSSTRMGIIKYFKLNAHDGDVSQVAIVENLGCIITCGRDGCVQMIELDKPKVKKTFLCHKKSVACFLWIPHLKVVASSSIDRRILFWDPYTLTIGHELQGEKNRIFSSVIDMNVIREYSLLVTLTMSGRILVWDLFSWQQVKDIGPVKLSQPFTAMAYNPKTGFLFASDPGIHTWVVRKKVSLAQMKKKSHKHKVLLALYNQEFGQVVSIAETEINVWDFATGRLVFRFINPHGENVRVTAACFDTGGRRLATGAQDGSIKFWNFHSGNCLGTLKRTKDGIMPPLLARHRDDCEIAAVLCVTLENINGPGLNRVVKDHVVATGWDQHVYVFNDAKRTIEEYSHTMPRNEDESRSHKYDINCLEFIPPNFICTASADGIIVVWAIESGSLRHILLDKEAAYSTEQSKNEISLQNNRSRKTNNFIDCRFNREWMKETALQKAPDLAFEKPSEDNIIGENFVHESTRPSSVQAKNIQESKLDSTAKQQQYQSKNHKFESRPNTCLEGNDMHEYKQAHDNKKTEMARLRKNKKLGIPCMNDKSIDCLLFLPRLKCLVSSGADGTIRFWDPINGKLAFRFNSKLRKQNSIVSLCVDTNRKLCVDKSLEVQTNSKSAFEASNCNTLFAGDSVGNIHLLDISLLHEPPRLEKGEYLVSWKQKWKNAHDGAITSLEYVFNPISCESTSQFVISASFDCTVKLWNTQGELIGFFGQSSQWNLEKEASWITQSKSSMLSRSKAVKLAQTLTKTNSRQNSIWEKNEELNRREENEKLNQRDGYILHKANYRNRYSLKSLDEILMDKVKNKVDTTEKALLRRSKSMTKYSSKNGRIQAMHRLTLPEVVEIQSPIYKTKKTI